MQLESGALGKRRRARLEQRQTELKRNEKLERRVTEEKKEEARVRMQARKRAASAAAAEAAERAQRITEEKRLAEVCNSVNKVVYCCEARLYRVSSA